MKITETIFQDGTHKWVAIVRDPDKPNFLVDTNEYLVTHGGQGMLLDSRRFLLNSTRPHWQRFLPRTRIRIFVHRWPCGLSSIRKCVAM
jgi:hypothetical protein